MAHITWHVVVLRTDTHAQVRAPFAHYVHLAFASASCFPAHATCGKALQITLHEILLYTHVVHISNSPSRQSLLKAFLCCRLGSDICGGSAQSVRSTLPIICWGGSHMREGISPGLCGLESACVSPSANSIGIVSRTSTSLPVRVGDASGSDPPNMMLHNWTGWLFLKTGGKKNKAAVIEQGQHRVFNWLWRKLSWFAFELLGQQLRPNGIFHLLHPLPPLHQIGHEKKLRMTFWLTTNEKAWIHTNSHMISEHHGRTTGLSTVWSLLCLLDAFLCLRIQYLYFRYCIYIYIFIDILDFMTQV